MKNASEALCGTGRFETDHKRSEQTTADSNENAAKGSAEGPLLQPRLAQSNGTRFWLSKQTRAFVEQVARQIVCFCA